MSAELTAAAIKVRHAIVGGYGADRLHKRAKLTALQNHWPELFEALADLLVEVNPPPPANPYPRLDPAKLADVDRWLAEAAHPSGQRPAGAHRFVPRPGDHGATLGRCEVCHRPGAGHPNPDNEGATRAEP